MTSIGSITPAYDADGNVLSDGLHAYTWYVYGRPLTIDSVGITYDALGRLVEGNKGYFYQIVYAPTGQKLAIMGGQSLYFAFVPLTAGAVAEYHGNGVFYYRHADWLGSSRFVSTTSGTMYSDTAYAPFGEPYAQSGTSDLSFTGMNQDTVSGLYDFPAREYSIQGRWPSPDPAGLAAVDPTDPQSWNRYAYVLNNPMNSVDPSGLAVGCVHMLYDDASCSDGGFFGGGGLSMGCKLYVWMVDSPGSWDSQSNATGHYEGMLCGGGGGGSFGGSGGGSRSGAKGGNSSGGATGNQGPSFFDKFAACTEANRLDNALRALGQAYDHPDLGNAAANLTNTATAAAIGNQALNLTASALVPAVFRGGYHSTSWPHFLGGLLSQATGNNIFSTVGKAAGRGLSAVAAVTIVAEGAYNGAAMARCGVVTALGKP
jgi:RHS repeat-associated protein